MAKARIRQKLEVSLDIDLPDEGNNHQKEQNAKALADRVQIIIDEFFIAKEKVHVNRCMVIPFTQTVMIL